MLCTTGYTVNLRQKFLQFPLTPSDFHFLSQNVLAGGHVIFLESIFQHSLHEIVIYSINRKSYNKKVNIL